MEFVRFLLASYFAYVEVVSAECLLFGLATRAGAVSVSVAILEIDALTTMRIRTTVLHRS